MVLSTSRLRNEYGPGCLPASQRVTLSLHGKGKITIATVAVDAFRALNACLVHHDYKTRAADTGAYNCRKITGGSGLSLHSFGIAADLNWSTNPYGRKLITDMGSMPQTVKKIRTRNGKQVFRWGGDYSTNKDAMHFEIVCTRADLRTGIDATTVPGGVVPSCPGVPKIVTRQKVAGVWQKGDQGLGWWMIQGLLNVLIDAKMIKVQKRLAEDGIFGDKSREAVLAAQDIGRFWQKAMGNKVTIARDGVVRKGTLDVISFWAKARLGKK